MSIVFYLVYWSGVLAWLLAACWCAVRFGRLRTTPRRAGRHKVGAELADSTP